MSEDASIGCRRHVLDVSSHLYMRLCPSVCPLVRPSIGPLVRWSVTHESKSGKTSVLDIFLVCVLVGGHGVWMGVGCPCPPVRNDVVTPRHLCS